MESELLKISKRDYENNDGFAHFVDNEDINSFLNIFNQYPHAFVLGCVMDKQIKAERAWEIPYKVYLELGNFEIDFLTNIPLDKYKELFNDGSYHRFNDKCATEFYNAIHKIKNDYDGDAARIWSDNPSSASVVSRFLEFDGVGIKIATMAANILARDFKIDMSDYYSIDISPDVHVTKVMKRLGYLDQDATRDQLIYKARELNPEFPGIIDLACFIIGKKFCHPNNPKCDECPLNKECDYYLNLK